MSNMQELAKDKWLCPLSGKKFKGPEFVRKHILTKHLEKIGEVKKEVKLCIALDCNLQNAGFFSDLLNVLLYLCLFR